MSGALCIFAPFVKRNPAEQDNTGALGNFNMGAVGNPQLAVQDTTQGGAGALAMENHK